MLKNKNKNQNGITLVALVVTIVVLIILATISINIIFGEEGIIERARQAQDYQKIGEYLDLFGLAEASALIRNEGKIDLELFKAQVIEENIVAEANIEQEGDKYIITTSEGYKFEAILKAKNDVEVKHIGKGEAPEEPIVEVTGVSLDKTSITITTVGTETLTATVEPSNASNKKVTWSSSEEEIAIVDENGVVTGIKEGTTTITVTTEDGEKTATCKVTVETPLVTALTNIQTKTVHTQDRLGNPITVPGGFKVVEGELVQDGIVIEDSNITTYADGSTMGNQFVWVPVSNIDGDETSTNSKLIKVEDATTKEISEVEITLGRYETFSTTAQPKQLGKDYANGANDTYRIVNSVNNAYMKELNTTSDGVASDGTNGLNATYQTLGAFVESVEKNHGYYIARYEASYESGTGTDFSTYKMASKKSTTVSQSTTNDWSNASGRLWHLITQLQASKVARNMYNANDEESRFVVSDLINSYMWDTALMFITKVEDDGYHDDTDGNGTLKNAGETTDIKCNIYDMKGNLLEWTTEYSTLLYNNNSDALPCTYRGGYYSDSNHYTSLRYSHYTTYSDLHIGFRAGLYCKTGN